MVNQAIQPSKSDPKNKAIASLVLGIISIISGVGAIYIYGTQGWGAIFIIYSGIPILSIILGKISLKSDEKTFKVLAIAGIMFSTISLLGVIFVYLFIRGLGESM